MPILKAQAKDTAQEFIGLLRITHYIGKEASAMVSSFDQPTETLGYEQKIWKTWMKNYFTGVDFNSEIQTA